MTTTTVIVPPEATEILVDMCAWKRIARRNVGSITVIWCEGTPHEEREAIPFRRIDGWR